MPQSQPLDKSIIDSKEQISKYDKSNMLGSIESLADQIKHAWEETQQIEFTSSAKINNIVMAGMGGSGLGADVISYLFKDELSIPLNVINSYTLPGHVDENTLVMLSSYSGNTEEILSCAKQAQEKNAQIMIIAAGGKLKEIAEENNYTFYLVNPKYNPSNQPRMAIGYSIFGQIGLLAKAGIINLTNEQINETITSIIRVIEDNNVEVTPEENQAKLLAYTCIERRPALVASEFLSGAVHVSTNQFNENAKMFTDYKLVPELNHHLMEGLRFPKSNADSHIFLFINSLLYSDKNQKRMKLTQQVVEDNNIETLSIELKSETKIGQALELITLFAFTNFYVAMLEQIDPSPITFVNWFKEKLK